MINRLTFTPMNHSIDYTLDEILKKAISSGIASKDESSSYYDISIQFNDGSEVVAWNVNKYYAWFQKGQFKGPKDIPFRYNWENGRPTKKTMVRLIKIIKESKNRVVEDSLIQKYLKN